MIGVSAANWTGATRTRPLTILGVTVMALGLVSAAIVPTVAEEPGSRKASDQSTVRPDKYIISIDPARKSGVYWYLRRALGGVSGEKFGSGLAEVWSIPSSHLKRLGLQLKLLGSKITRLPEDWNHLLIRQRGSALSAAQDQMARQVRGSPEFVGVGMMRAQQAAVSEYALTIGADIPVAAETAPPNKSVSRIVIPISDTQQVTVQRLDVATTAKGTRWRGIVEESGESALLMWWRGGRISGVFAFKGHIYTIVHAGGDIHAVVEADPAKIPPDHAGVISDNAPIDDGGGPEALSETSGKAPTNIKPFSDSDRLALEASPITIDLMMLYTKRAASRYLQGSADIIELAIEQANQTFRNSGIPNVSLRLVHSQPIDYDETSGEKLEHLYRMVDGVGVFKDVRRLRDERRADIVGLMLEHPTGCGLSTRVGASAEEAYFVVHHSCAALTISIAHEVGHILGARHDRTADKSDTPIPYGHGYVNGKWRDIMSLQESCDGCPRVPFWSNPRVMYQGEPTGTLAEDNARLILEQAERVSKFR
jgi:hypothetical protein